MTITPVILSDLKYDQKFCKRFHHSFISTCIIDFCLVLRGPFKTKLLMKRMKRPKKTNTFYREGTEGGD